MTRYRLQSPLLMIDRCEDGFKYTGGVDLTDLVRVSAFGIVKPCRWWRKFAKYYGLKLRVENWKNVPYAERQKRKAAKAAAKNQTDGVENRAVPVEPLRNTRIDGRDATPPQAGQLPRYQDDYTLASVGVS